MSVQVNLIEIAGLVAPVVWSGAKAWRGYKAPSGKPAHFGPFQFPFVDEHSSASLSWVLTGIYVCSILVGRTVSSMFGHVCSTIVGLVAVIALYETARLFGETRAKEVKPKPGPAPDAPRSPFREKL